MFGWAMNVAEDEGYTLVGGEGDQPMGGIGPAGPRSPYTGIVVYFQVDNVDTALTRAEQLGGSRTLDPVSLPGMRRGCG
jgi:predicted enzyme related to lactoylglutathione lyase